MELSGIRTFCILRKGERKRFQEELEKEGKKRGKEHVLHHHWDLLAPPQHQEPFSSSIPSQRGRQKLQSLVEMKHFSFSKSGWSTRYKD